MQEELDGEEIVYVDFDRKEFVFTVPKFIVPDPGEIIGHLLRPRLMNGDEACLVALKFCIEEEHSPPEEKGKG